jgi:outer membrane protein insertion porin family
MNVVTVLMALLFGGIEPQTLQTPDPNRIEDVLIRGNRSIPRDSILYHLQTKRGDLVNPDVIRRDVKQLYTLQYFDDIEVIEEEGKTGKLIVFAVHEKPKIRLITYEGNSSITTSEILEKLRERKVGLSQESPYDPNRIKRAES